MEKIKIKNMLSEKVVRILVFNINIINLIVGLSMIYLASPFQRKVPMVSQYLAAQPNIFGYLLNMTNVFTLWQNLFGTILVFSAVLGYSKYRKIENGLKLR